MLLSDMGDLISEFSPSYEGFLAEILEEKTLTQQLSVQPPNTVPMLHQRHGAMLQFAPIISFDAN